MYDDETVRRMVEASRSKPPDEAVGPAGPPIGPFTSPEEVFAAMKKFGETIQPNPELLAKMPKILVLGQEIPPTPAALLTMLKMHTDIAESIKHMLDCHRCGPKLTPSQKVMLKQAVAVLDMTEYLPG